MVGERMCRVERRDIRSKTGVLASSGLLLDFRHIPMPICIGSRTIPCCWCMCHAGVPVLLCEWWNRMRLLQVLWLDLLRG